MYIFDSIMDLVISDIEGGGGGVLQLHHDFFQNIGRSPPMGLCEPRFHASLHILPHLLGQRGSVADHREGGARRRHLM